MSNLRIIYDNAADTATLSTSSTAGSLVASNMQTNKKMQVWRSTSTTASITATWPSGKMINGVILPFTNLTSGATIRVRGYTLTTDTTPIFDSGTIFACPAVPLGQWMWGDSQLGANSFSYGGGAYARCWLEIPFAVTKIAIDLVDTSNLSGYIEVGKIVAGKWWSPEVNTEVSATTIAVDDTTKQFRTDSGDLMSDNGIKYRAQTVNFPSMLAEDRQMFWNIAKGSGLGRPMLISVYPNDVDYRKEQMHLMFCKMVQSPTMGIPYFDHYESSINFEEI